MHTVAPRTADGVDNTSVNNDLSMRASVAASVHELRTAEQQPQQLSAALEASVQFVLLNVPMRRRLAVYPLMEATCRRN